MKARQVAAGEIARQMHVGIRTDREGAPLRQINGGVQARVGDLAESGLLRIIVVEDRHDRARSVHADAGACSFDAQQRRLVDFGQRIGGDVDLRKGLRLSRLQNGDSIRRTDEIGRVGRQRLERIVELDRPATGPGRGQRDRNLERLCSAAAAFAQGAIRDAGDRVGAIGRDGDVVEIKGARSARWIEVAEAFEAQ
ncbi:MAG: hypothetical protein BWZ10_02694 [candidate division BRC1 bacterium ADurb.BinA364]|nr:MAG: hypothetical protein BWZ10_02694 [candidate division BRC1 bacterium ADurb.BinA364]